VPKNRTREFEIVTITLLEIIGKQKREELTCTCVCGDIILSILCEAQHTKSMKREMMKYRMRPKYSARYLPTIVARGILLNDHFVVQSLSAILARL
jgi:hypothetical protein